MKDCILDSIRRQGPPICTEDNLTEYERLIDGYAIEILNLLCGDHTEDSDKCEKIVKQTPAKLASQRKPKSLLPPFIRNLENS